MSSTPPSKPKPQRPKSAARLASEANPRQQLAVRTNSPRPNDRKAHDELAGHPGRPPRRTGQ